MEFLADSLKEVVSKLNEDQKEEVDVIESIVNTDESMFKLQGETVGFESRILMSNIRRVY